MKYFRATPVLIALLALGFTSIPMHTVEAKTDRYGATTYRRGLHLPKAVTHSRRADAQGALVTRQRSIGNTFRKNRTLSHLSHSQKLSPQGVAIKKKRGVFNNGGPFKALGRALFGPR